MSDLLVKLIGLCVLRHLLTYLAVLISTWALQGSHPNNNTCPPVHTSTSGFRWKEDKGPPQ